MAADAHLGNRVRVVYESGSEIYVNGSPSPWTVETAVGKYELPQWGYVATTKAGARAMSVLWPASGSEQSTGPRQRVDFAIEPDSYYADSRGGLALLPKVAVQGSGALKREKDAWYIVPATGFTEFAFDPALIGLSPDHKLTVAAENQDGSPAEPPEVLWSAGLWHVRPGAKPAFRYQVVPSPASAPSAIEGDFR